jgi:hypothetical protein
MRLTAVFFSVLCAGAWSQVRAAEPQPQSPPPATVAPAAQQSATTAVEPRATAPAAAPNAGSPASGSQAATAATPPTGKEEPTAGEKELMARGYKLEIRHGQRYFCRRESSLGSHFDVKSCNTPESIETHRANSVETVREMQANKPEISN